MKPTSTSRTQGQALGRTLYASPAMRAARDARTESAPVPPPASDRRAHRRVVETSTDPVRVAEAQAAIERLDRLADITKLQGRLALDTGQAFTLMQLGATLRLGRLKDLAPTAQVAKWCRDYGRVKAWLDHRQVAALSWYHALHLMTLVGRAGVNPEDVRVDGGGGGCVEYALAHAMDAARTLQRAKAALPTSEGRPLEAQLLDWVVLNDRPIDDFKIVGFRLDGERAQENARRLLFWQASTHLADHIGG